jgi:hypothetical protein
MFVSGAKYNGPAPFFSRIRILIEPSDALRAECQAAAEGRLAMRIASFTLRLMEARLGVIGKYSRPRERPEPGQLDSRIFELTPRGCVQFSADEGPGPARAQGH